MDPRILVSGTHPQNIHEPKRAGDVGYDLVFSENKGIYPLQCTFVKTGVRVKLPDGYWAEIVGRSSAIVKYGFVVVNSIIDNGYTGELTVGLLNISGSRQFAVEGCRCAQLILHRREVHPVHLVLSLPETARGDQGFGSTGTR